jgi:hypothetical protein
LYYALPVTDSDFQVSATPNGSPITLTTDGVSVIVAADIDWQALGEAYSRFADGFLPAHAVPLPAPYPVTVVAVVAQLMAARAQILSGVTSVSMKEAELSAKGQLERWAKTLPVRDAAPATVPANVAITGSPVIGPPTIGPPCWPLRGFGWGSGTSGLD